jgi:hypothetical protein
MVRANCGQCGDVEFVSEDVQVRVSESDGSGTYTYCCPRCHGIRQHPASGPTLRLLIDSGSVRIPDELPAELDERDTDAPLFTHDDLLAFRQVLQQDDWFDALLAED